MLSNLENKLLDLFRAFDDDRKAAVLYIVQKLLELDRSSFSAGSVDLPPASGTAPDPVQTSVRVQRMIGTAQKADIPAQYQMVMEEMNYLIDLTQRDRNPFNALCFAFDYGFVKGSRATRRGKVKAL